MFAIFKKEFRSYFRRGYGIIFLAVAAFFTGLMITAYTLYYGSPKAEMLLPGLAILFSLALPILSMNIFSRDRLARTDRLLYSLPFKSSDIVVGKYAALLCIFGIEVVVLAFLPIVIGFFAPVNYASSYLSIVCFLLCGAMILALCSMFAASTKSSLMTVIFSYISIIASFLLYLVPVGSTSGLWKTVAGALRFLSPFSHLDDFLIGKLKITSFVYFALFIALFIFLAIRSVSKTRAKNDYGKKADETKKFSLSAALAIILCICTIAANGLAAIVPTRFSTIDLTSEKMFSVGKQTKEYIKAMDTNVSIYVLDADSSNKTLESLLTRYDEFSDAITVEYTTPYDIQDLLVSLGWDGSSALEPYTLIFESDKERYDVITPSSLYYYENPQFGTLTYSDYSSYLSTLYQYAASSSEYQSALQSLLNDTKFYYNAEQLINNSLEYLTVDIIPTPYYLTGHGEPSIEDSNLLTTFSYVGFPIETFDLSQNAQLPENAYSIFINNPTTDLTDAQAQTLLEFLKNGGSLTLITNEANLDMPNLMSLMSAYGLSASKGFVSFDYEAAKAEADAEKEANSDENTEADAEAEEVEEELPDKNLVTANVNTSHEAFAALEGYYGTFLRANEITIATDLRDTAKATAILTTDEKCFIDGVEDSTSAKTIAVMVQEDDTMVSWFTGGASFEGEDAEVININAYISLYAVVFGVDNYVSELTPAAPRLISQESLSIETGTKLALILTVTVVIPAAIAIVGTVFIKKYKKAPKKELQD